VESWLTTGSPAFVSPDRHTTYLVAGLSGSQNTQLESSARTITSAALVMVTVFAAFAAGRLVPFKEMGLGLAAAVLIDATLIRTILVPAVMRLVGRRNWWMPRAVDRWLPAIALEAPAGDPDDRKAREPAGV